jgi:membrane fusion protein, multidrug efflux system
MQLNYLTPSYYRILFFSLILMAACSSKKEDKTSGRDSGVNAKNAPVKVEAYVVDKKTITNAIDVPGNIVAYESTELHPEVSGRITQLNIKEGSYVGKGTLLVKLFDGDLQAQLRKLQVQLKINEKTTQRQGELLKINGISEQEYDLSGLEVSNIKADIELLRTNIARTEVRAPFNGKIGLRNISLGAYVTPATILTTIRQVSNLKLEFTVPEKYASEVKAGMNIIFELDGSSKKFTAKVLASESGVAENNRSLKVRAIVNNKDALLVPGLFAKVSFNLGENTIAILIPTQAIIPGARTKEVIVLKNGQAAFTKVETGIRDSSYIQITMGLSPGDTVITTGLLAIKPGAKLQITSVKK